MIATITLNSTINRLKHAENISDLRECFGSSLLLSDIFAIWIGEYYTSKDRGYKANGKIAFDTVSIHSNGDNIGLRFYWKTKNARNKRGAFYAQFDINVSAIHTAIQALGLGAYCDNLADQAVQKLESF